MKIGQAIAGAVLACAIAWPNLAAAQGSYGGRYGDRYGNRTTNYGESASTEQFVQEAAQGGMAEVSLSMLASRRASDQDVRNFAQQMVQDHSQANRQLRRLAMRKGLSLPNPPHQMTMNRLRARNGTAFDRTYMREMVQDHDATVALFRDYARNGDDPEVRAWATATLPTLRHHWRMANRTAENGEPHRRLDRGRVALRQRAPLLEELRAASERTSFGRGLVRGESLQQLRQAVHAGFDRRLRDSAHREPKPAVLAR